MDPNGSPAYFDFGWELPDWARSARFADISLVCYWSDALGYRCSMLDPFHATR